jgi:hypothetical protein
MTPHEAIIELGVLSKEVAAMQSPLLSRFVTREVVAALFEYNQAVSLRVRDLCIVARLDLGGPTGRGYDFTLPSYSQLLQREADILNVMAVQSLYIGGGGGGGAPLAGDLDLKDLLKWAAKIAGAVFGSATLGAAAGNMIADDLAFQTACTLWRKGLKDEAMDQLKLLMEKLFGSKEALKQTAAKLGTYAAKAGLSGNAAIKEAVEAVAAKCLPWVGWGLLLLDLLLAIVPNLM